MEGIDSHWVLERNAANLHESGRWDEKRKRGVRGSAKLYCLVSTRDIKIKSHLVQTSSGSIAS